VLAVGLYKNVMPVPADPVYATIPEGRVYTLHRTLRKDVQLCRGLFPRRETLPDRAFSFLTLQVSRLTIPGGSSRVGPATSPTSALTTFLALSFCVFYCRPQPYRVSPPIPYTSRVSTTAASAALSRATIRVCRCRRLASNAIDWTPLMHHCRLSG
jgi:hypothetical protein